METGAAAVVMAAGGMLGARKVATVMRKKVAWGTSANLVTATLVLGRRSYAGPCPPRMSR